MPHGATANSDSGSLLACHTGVHAHGFTDLLVPYLLSPHLACRWPLDSSLRIVGGGCSDDGLDFCGSFYAQLGALCLPAFCGCVASCPFDLSCIGDSEHLLDLALCCLHFWYACFGAPIVLDSLSTQLICRKALVTMGLNFHEQVVPPLLGAADQSVGNHAQQLH